MQHPSMKSEKDAVHSALRQAIDEPTLTHARSLESALRRVGTTAKVFGRLNQKSSIDAAAESTEASLSESQMLSTLRSLLRGDYPECTQVTRALHRETPQIGF